MNHVQLLGKIGIYQMKVFVSSYFKLKTNKYTHKDIDSLHKAKYLYKWQYKILDKVN